MLSKVGSHFEFHFSGKFKNLTPLFEAVVRFLHEIIRQVNAMHTQLHLCPGLGSLQDLLQWIFSHSVKFVHRFNVKKMAAG